MTVEQFVMAYGVKQDRLRAFLPDVFRSLRPVLRINTEIWQDGTVYLEFNTSVEAFGKTLPAFPTKPTIQYERQPFTPKVAAAIPCEQVLASYKVPFEQDT